MKTQLGIQRAPRNRFRGACKLHLSPFNLSLAMFPFLSPTRHCTKRCFVSRQQTVSPPLVTPVSALPSCPMASAPSRIYCCCLRPLAGRGLWSAEMSDVTGVLARRRDPASTLTHPDGLQWLERGQVRKRKKKHAQNIRDEHEKMLNVPLTSRE